MKKKKIELLEQRLDRELERKKNESESSKGTAELKVRVNDHVESNKRIKLDKKDDDGQENRTEVHDDKPQTQLEQMKDEFNQLVAKKSRKKKKKKVETAPKLSDEDNPDLQLDRTISIALPASIILNAQTPELKAYLVGQVARCAAIFKVNEIVVFDEHCTGGDYNDDECEDDKVTCVRQMGNLLRYLECPQYLRKSLFPLHKDFRSAGVINPLDTKHHLRFEDESEFREGEFLKSPIITNESISLVLCLRTIFDN